MAALQGGWHHADMGSTRYRLLPLVAALIAASWVSGCSQLAESSPVQGVKNQAVCALGDQPLQAIVENIDKVDKSPTGMATGIRLAGAAGSLDGLLRHASGQLATDLAVLKEATSRLITSLDRGATEAHVKKRVSEVKSSAIEVQADCST